MQSIHIRVPDEIHEALRKEAFGSRRSMNQIITERIRFEPRAKSLVGEALKILVHDQKRSPASVRAAWLIAGLLAPDSDGPLSDTARAQLNALGEDAS